MTLPTPAQRLAMRELPSGFPVMHQRWAGLLFLHWPIDPSVIKALLPNGLDVDTFDGNAWLGVVPFFMERVRPVFLPPVPRLSWFQELNVRTYVYDSQGRPGVWFFSLDCNQPIAVEIARRLFHLPYEHALMDAQRFDQQIIYHCRRDLPDAQLANFTYPAPVAPKPALENSLEWFLVERYLLFSVKRDGQLCYGRVHHRPYQIAETACQQWSAEPLQWNGFETPSDPPASVLVADSIEVSVYPLKKI